ncbi:MAG: hypothetical protein HY438_01675 [DPANN group archaeon]|nr:hypothetical protein [DPANN group archaeon]
MKKLKSYIVERVEASRIRLHIKLSQVQEAQKLLQDVNFGDATYLVSIYSLWTDNGEKSTVTLHKGSLEGAIKVAEDEFESANKRRDDQKIWQVQLVLGLERYNIPETYWEKYKTSRD